MMMPDVRKLNESVCDGILKLPLFMKPHVLILPCVCVCWSMFKIEGGKKKINQQPAQLGTDTIFIILYVFFHMKNFNGLDYKWLVRACVRIFSTIVHTTKATTH